MSVHFGRLCGLFDIIDGLQAKRTDKLNVAIHAWFDEHGPDIPRYGPGAVAFLSCLFPERRPDRVYGLRQSDLERIIRSAHGLGRTRMSELQCWRDPDGPDFASAVQRVLSAAESTSRSQETVTVGEIEQVLNRVASRSPFSSSSLKEEVRRASSKPVDRFKELIAIFRRLHSCSTKWMIRIIFKDLSTLELPEQLILQRFHFLLPDLLRFQNSFHACIAALETDAIGKMPIKPAGCDEKLLRESASGHFKPCAGIMVGLPSRDKARSITHCCQLAKGRAMSVEEKYDGEYCQIHVCLSGSSYQIQIFSKSGRDSTTDRAGVHDAIVTGLAIGTPRCRFQRTCIMEGELLVWDDNGKQIEPFRKIRRHVQRAGYRLGCAQDSPVQESEHLMVMLYDLLQVDDNVCVQEPHDRRRRRLHSIVRPTPGRLDIGTRTKIEFGSRGAAGRLRERFADTIARGGEGLVLKGCADPYLSLHDSVRQIKLKKDYIAGLGDTLDFAIVGGRRDARDEAELRMGKLSWTSFYAACLENKDQVQRFNTKPIFRVVARIDRHGVSETLIRYLNQHGNFCRVPFARVQDEMEVLINQEQLRRPSELFKNPLLSN